MAEQTQPAVQTTVTVGAANQILLPAENRRRVVFVLTNTSAGGQVITINFGQVAVQNEGIVLKAGEKYGEAEDLQFRPYQGTINAFSSAGGGTVAVYARYA